MQAFFIIMSNRSSLSFTIFAVVAIMGTAGWLLWRSQDPRLVAVEFETMSSAAAKVGTPEDVITDAEPPTDAATQTNRVSATELTALETTVSSDGQSEEVFEQSANNDVITTNVSNEINPTTTATTNNSIPEIDDAVVVVSIIGPSVKERCAVTITETTTVHKVMQTAGRQCGFSYSGKKQGDLGFFVQDIAGLSQSVNDGYYWIFSVNGKKSQLGVSTRTVKPGDTIQWTYEAEY